MHIFRTCHLLFLLSCFTIPLQGMIAPNHTKLCNAIKTGDLAVVEQELSTLHDIDECIAPFDNPLHLAIRHEQPAIVEFLIKHNVNLNITDVIGNTPLHQAMENPTIMQLLLNAGADPTIENAYGDTPLDLASQICKDSTIINLLVDAGSPLTKERIFDYILDRDVVAPCLSVHILQRGLNPFFSAMNDSFAMRIIHHINNGRRKPTPYISLLQLCSKTARLHPYFMNHYTVDEREKMNNLLIEHEKATAHLLAENDFSWLSDDWLGKNPTSNNIDVQDELDATLLMYAAAAGNVDAVTWLLRHNAHVLLRTKHHENVFDIVMQIMQNMQLDQDQTVPYNIILRLCYQVLITNIIKIKPMIKLPLEILHHIITYILRRNDLKPYELLSAEEYNIILNAQKIKQAESNIAKQMMPVMVGVAMGGNEITKLANPNEFPDNQVHGRQVGNPITEENHALNDIPAAVATPCSWKKYSIGTAGIAVAALYALYTHYSATTTTLSETD